MKVGINLARICCTVDNHKIHTEIQLSYLGGYAGGYSGDMLDLTGDAHLQRMPTVNHIPRTFIDRFYAKFLYRFVGLAVLAQETSTDVWSISTFPGLATIPVDDLNSSDYQFYGGQTYAVSGSLATALTNANYEVT